MLALVDCNNFYCSCERVFNPSLIGRPIVVLSNNDGCIIARSDEAKQIGINMGAPEYLVRDLLQKNNTAVFSSNYTLYGDMSARVMKILSSFVPEMELYSIDEAFLNMGQLAYADLTGLGLKIRQTVLKYTGIPVTVGIGATKALAKLANRYAKKNYKALGVHWLANNQLTQQALAATEVGDVWGIGHQYAGMLYRQGIKTALAFTQLPEDWVRQKMSVTGLRLFHELHGRQSTPMEFEPQQRKNICTSRSFGNLTDKKDILIEAISNHAAACALKLRQEKTCARIINVFIVTNQFRLQDSQYRGSINIQAEVSTSNSSEIIKYSLKGLDIIFRDGYSYQKCGVIVSDITPEDIWQADFFNAADRKKDKTVMAAMDKINHALGKETVRFATQGFGKRYRLKAEYLSQRYSTNINELLHVKN